MTTPVDEALIRRFDGLVVGADDADWNDVERRYAAERRRGAVRRGMAVVVGLAAVGLAAPAFGLPGAVIDWFSAEPASPRVQLQFSELPAVTAGGRSNVESEGARTVTRVRHDGTTFVLSVAPTSSGGFCYQWTDLLGGCHRRTQPPETRPDRDHYLLGASWSSNPAGVVELISGSVVAPSTDTLIAELADGRELEMPFTWVSAPINAGFYLFFPPPVNETRGHEVTAIKALDSGGRVLARQLIVP